MASARMRWAWLLVAALVSTGLWLASGCDDGGDGDGDADSDSDTDGDADSSGDADDSGGDPGDGPPCADERGTCEALVGGCAACPVSTVPTAWVTDCRSTEWCCAGRDPVANDCEQGGGVCLPVVPGAVCPTGWEETATSCGMGGSCCEPAAACN